MKEATTYSFEANIASRGYHVYKNTPWVNKNEGDEVQAEIERKKYLTNFYHYSCAICVNGK